jgi:hypothetical protein
MSFVPTHIATLGNSQDSPRTRFPVRILCPSDIPRFFVCEDASGTLYRLFEQNLSIIKHDPTTPKSTTVVEPPAQVPPL